MRVDARALAAIEDELTTWRQDQPAAFAFIGICAHMASRPLPKSVFSAMTTQEGDARGRWIQYLDPMGAEHLGDPSGLHAVIRLCSDTYLITDSPLSITMHDMTQEAVRAVAGDANERHLRLALVLLEASFPEPRDTGMWPVAHQLRPHAESTLSHAAAMNLKDYAAGRLAHYLASYVFLCGAPLQSRDLVRLGLDVTLSEDPAKMLLLDGLGVINRQLGDFDRAHEAYEALLHWSQRQSVPLPAPQLNNLAMFLHSVGELGNAEALLKRAVADARGPHEEADAFGNLGIVLRDAGHALRAEDTIRASLRIREGLVAQGELPPDHFSIADDHANLGTVLYDAGRLMEALDEHRTALRMHQRLLGNIHQSVAGDYGNMANVLISLGDLDAATARIEEMLSILIRLYGRTAPQTREIIEWLQEVRPLSP